MKNIKFLTEFDWGWADGLDRNQVETLMTLDFMKSATNIIFSGSEGLGKSMVARNIGYQAVLRGHNVLFVDTAEILKDLGHQESPRLLNIRMKRYTAPDLLILDEYGYLSYDCRAADLLFEIIKGRYEKRSIIITTNLAFTDWPKMFPGATCVRAMIDRLIHRSEILNLSGDHSYRLKEANDRQKKKAQKKPRKKTGRKE